MLLLLPTAAPRLPPLLNVPAAEPGAEPESPLQPSQQRSHTTGVLPSLPRRTGGYIGCQHIQSTVNNAPCTPPQLPGGRPAAPTRPPTNVCGHHLTPSLVRSPFFPPRAALALPFSSPPPQHNPPPPSSPVHLSQPWGKRRVSTPRASCATIAGSSGGRRSRTPSRTPSPR